VQDSGNGFAKVLDQKPAGKKAKEADGIVAERPCRFFVLFL